MSLIDRAERFVPLFPRRFRSYRRLDVCIRVRVSLQYVEDGLDLDFMDGRDESGPWSWGHISNKQLIIK
ncbi:hypothetical protein MRB53_009171 [Persea americana]|uniref:Uncharacterized protein n=1 Tax=Persea americana TaxID=3435 RepID=A0ACC2LPC1_PERAE|nr:hypothetical protein MRB53_009171 [Persea americana]